MPKTSSATASLATLLAPAPLDSSARLYRLAIAGPTGGHTSTDAETTQNVQAIVQALHVEAWIAREALGALGELNLLALSLQADLPMDALIGQGLSLHTVLADGSLSKRSGLVRQAERLDAHGGLARYRLVLAPWLWLATQQARSQIFQDRSIAEIIETVLAPYATQGASWRFTDEARAHLQQSARRSHCTQWRESDWAFLSRLLAEEGLGWRVEHSDAVAWSHEVIIFADSTLAEAIPENPSSPTRFHRQSSQESTDAVQALARQTRLAATSISAAAWDPDARQLHQAGATSLYSPERAPHIAHDVLLGQDDHSRGLGDSQAVERHARQLIEAIEARADTLLGRSNLRTALCGTRLVINEAPALGLAHDHPTIVFEAIEHAGFNDLPTGNWQAIEAQLGRPEDHLVFDAAPPAPDAEPDCLGLLAMAEPAPWFDEDGLAQGFDAVSDNGFEQEPGAPWSRGLDAQPDAHANARADARLLATARAHGYANRFRAILAERPWRPARPTPQSVPGPMLQPRPLAHGVHSAVVVGPDGATSASGTDEIYVNARGDVRVRFHWQDARVRQTQGSEPRPDDRSTRWVRVAQRQAGEALGWQFIPRIGQEVLVKFTEGDPDQPIVVGALFNGRGAGGIAPTPGGAPAAASDDAALFAQAHDGAPSAQANLAAGLGGGHAPTWHAASPDAQGHRNAAALWGFRSKELGGSGFNQLVFDDSDAQLRIQLASSSQDSELNLGHIIHQQDNFRGSLRGQGFELRTDGYAAIRGGMGVLLSTYHGPDGARLEPTADFASGMALLKQLTTLSQSLDGAASTHWALRLPGHAGSHQEGASLMDDGQAPHAALLRSASTMVDGEDTAAALAEAPGKSPATGEGRVPHTGDAVIAAAARAGLLGIAGQHLQLAAGEDVTLAAGGAINLALNAQARWHAGQAIGLVAAAAGADHEDTGLSIIAAQDDIDVQAQSDAIKVQAREQLTLQSANAAVEMAAARRIRIATAQGAAITIEGGNITFEAPGAISYKAGMRTFAGPTQLEYVLPVMPNSQSSWVKIDAHYDNAWNTRWPLQNIKMEMAGSTVRKKIQISPDTSR